MKQLVLISAFAAYNLICLESFSQSSVGLGLRYTSIDLFDTDVSLNQDQPWGEQERCIRVGIKMDYKSTIKKNLSWSGHAGIASNNAFYNAYDLRWPSEISGNGGYQRDPDLFHSIQYNERETFVELALNLNYQMMYKNIVGLDLYAGPGSFIYVHTNEIRTLGDSDNLPDEKTSEKNYQEDVNSTVPFLMAGISLISGEFYGFQIEYSLDVSYRFNDFHADLQDVSSLGRGFNIGIRYNFN